MKGQRRGLWPSMPLRVIIILALALPALGALGALVPVARAATCTVTNTNDSGAGSLRSCVASAGAGDTIVFNLPANSTIRLSNCECAGGPLQIDKDLTIDGSTATNLTISQVSYYTVIQIEGAHTVALRNLTISDGATGIDNPNGAVTLTNVTVSNNYNRNYEGSALGGGIYNGGSLALINSTVTKNGVSANYGNAWGGGIYNDDGRVTLTNSTISDNSADGSSDGGDAAGGGIYSAGSGTLTIGFSTVTGNSSSAAFGTASGGGIYNSGTAAIANSTIKNNSSYGASSYGTYSVDSAAVAALSIDTSAFFGGGLFNDQGDLTINMSTIAGNSADDDGGGLFNNAGAVTIYSSAITDNTASSGVGIYNQDGTLAVDGSVISGNCVIRDGRCYDPGIGDGPLDLYSGGGILNNAGAANATVHVSNSTIRNNVIGNEGGGIANYAGISSRVVVTASVNLFNTTLDDNVARDGVALSNHADNGSTATLGVYFSTLTNHTAVANNDPDAAPAGVIYNAYSSLAQLILRGNALKNPTASYSSSGSVSVSGSYNIFGDNAFSAVLNDPTNEYNEYNTDPLLGELADNGGTRPGAPGGNIPLRTRVPQAGSHAIDKVPAASCQAPDAAGATQALGRDERGFPRPQGTNCDAGAVEVTTSKLVVAAASGTYGGTAALSATLTDANGRPLAGQTVAFTLNGNPAGNAVTNNQGVAAIASASLAGIGGGTYPTGVGAAFAGGAGYPAAGGTGALTVNPAPQTITFAPLADKMTQDPPFTVGASASSGLPVAFSASGPCTVSGTTVTLTGAAGTCTITASQPGDANYQAASPVARSFQVIAPSPSPSPAAQFTLTLIIPSGGAIDASPPGTIISPTVRQYPAGTVVTLTPLPDPGKTFISWAVDGTIAQNTDGRYQIWDPNTTAKGWAVPLTITLNASHAVEALFVTTPAFTDLPAGDPALQAATELTARGGIFGCAVNGTTSVITYCPARAIKRAEMAALIVRTMGWATESPANPFKDQCDPRNPANCVDDELWRSVGILAAKGVTKGYTDAATCGGERYVPCFAPLDPIAYDQVLLFISRAMIARNYWLGPLGDDRQIFPNLPAATEQDRADRVSIIEYVFYAGAPPDMDVSPGQPFVVRSPGREPAGPGVLAPRDWCARALWQALNSYWGVDQPKNHGGFVP